MQSQFERHIPKTEIALFNTGNASRAWRSFGCHYIPEARVHRFMLWAPNAKAVSLVGDFNAWEESAQPMERQPGGIWVCFVQGIKAGAEYMYCVTGADNVKRMKADPFAMHSRTRGEAASLIWNGGSFEWSDDEYMRSRAALDKQGTAMSVYEVHAGSWKAFKPGKAIYRVLGDALAVYCKDMGFTHVEFLPLTEHPFDGSWGYQVTGYFAPSSRFGDPDDFKYLVDRLHAEGIGVIIDWVPAHFPKDGYGLASFDGTPLFECKDKERASHPQWGTLLFDYASAQVQSFLISSACMFLEEYHVDGIRVDAVSSMLYMNFGREYGKYLAGTEEMDIDPWAEKFLRKLNCRIKSDYPGTISIAEESTAYPGVTESAEKDGLGFDFKWDMGYMHDTLDYMALPPYMRRKEHHKLSFSMMYAFNENYILAYSHDEVTYGKRSMLEKMPGKLNQKLASLRALYAYQFAHPGKKLCFMGGEFAQASEWNHDEKLDWLLLKYPQHEKMRLFYRELNRLYTSIPALYRVDRSWDGFKWLNVDDAESCSIAFMRSAQADDSYLVCACNFSASGKDKFVIGLPAAGTLEELLNSDDRRFGGSGILNNTAIKSSKIKFNEFPHSAELSLPPLTAVMFRFTPVKE
ncbi:MAG: 1,4-alpha-glucan branching protein GlgB [Oscillospiraceae bacterium]|nr:1,4-alpha-glucan branching protein GlgB [Oscillospiraceae bacterium]